MMGLQRYDITVGCCYERGKSIFLADLLSRAYLTEKAEPEGTEIRLET